MSIQQRRQGNEDAALLPTGNASPLPTDQMTCQTPQATFKNGRNKGSNNRQDLQLSQAIRWSAEELPIVLCSSTQLRVDWESQRQVADLLATCAGIMRSQLETESQGAVVCNRIADLDGAT